MMAALRSGILVLAIVMSGCAAGESATKAPATSAPAATVSADSGSITGRITDDELQVIVGAQVGVSGPAESLVETDAEGRFTFNDLAPGEYAVIAQKLGYESAAKRVTVEAGKATEVSVILAPVAILSEPRVVQFHDRGHIANDVWTAGVGVYGTAGKTFTHNMTEGAVNVVSSMIWDSATPVTGRYMLLRLTYDSATNSTTGRSPRTTEIEELDVEGKKAKFTIFWRGDFACPVNPMCYVENPDALIPQISYEQDVDIYSHVFYVNPAPEGYHAYPD